MISVETAHLRYKKYSNSTYNTANMETINSEYMKSQWNVHGILNLAKYFIR